MMLGLIFLAADKITSCIAGCRIPLVAVAPSSLLRWPFSLYASYLNHTCYRTFFALRAVFTASTILAVSLQLPAGSPAFWGRESYYSSRSGALTGRGNSAATVLSWAVSRPIVVVQIFRLTVCHCCTGTVLVPDAATLVILGRVGRCGYVRIGMSFGAVHKTMGARRDCRVGLSTACCLRVCLVAAAVANSRSETSGVGVPVAEGVHAGVVFAATVRRISLVRSATWFRSWTYSSLGKLMILFV